MHIIDRDKDGHQTTENQLSNDNMGELQREEGTMMVISGSTPISSPLQKGADIIAHGNGIGVVEQCHYQF